MFLRFYPQEGDTAHIQAKLFAEKAGELGIQLSPAQVQGYFMFYKDSPKDMVANIQDITKLWIIQTFLLKIL